MKMGIVTQGVVEISRRIGSLTLSEFRILRMILLSTISMKIKTRLKCVRIESRILPPPESVVPDTVDQYQKVLRKFLDPILILIEDGRA